MACSIIATTLVFLLFCLGSYCLQWTVNDYSLSEKLSSQDYIEMIKFNVTPSVLCTYDRLNVMWKATSSFPGFEYLQKVALMVSNYGERTAFASSLISTADLHYHLQQHLHGLSCLKANSLCIPSTKDLVLNPYDGKISVEFDQDTNSPILDSLQLLLNTFQFIPEINGTSTSAEWINSRKLIISLESNDMQRILTAYNHSDPVKLIVRDYRGLQDISSLTGEIVFHPPRHGTSQLFAVDSQTGNLISQVYSINVEHCEHHDILPSPSFSDPKKQQAIPKFHIKGIIPTNGFESIKVSAAAVPAMTTDSWAISFWIRILEAPNGVYRSLMYKGVPGQDLLQRTPSAWLLPNSNHITIRVSTDQNPDEGIISNQELPIDKWTFVTMQFKNHTQESLRFSSSQDVSIKSNEFGWQSNKVQKDYSYSVKLYINGLLDLSAQFKRPLLSNNGTLMLFKDLSFVGPKAFVHDLVIWQSTMTSQDVLSLYVQGPKASVVQPVNEILSLLKLSSSKLLPYIVQEQLKNKSPLVDTAAQIAVDSSTEKESDDQMEDKTDANQDQIISFMNKKSKESIMNCEDYYSRLDIHAESAEMGSVEGLINWAKLLMYGYEIPDSKCGFSLVKQPSTFSKYYHQSYEAKQPLSIHEIPVIFQDIARANVAFITGLEKGDISSIMPFAMNLMVGVGLEPILQRNRELNPDWDIPFPLNTQKSKTHHKLLFQLQSYLSKALYHCNANTSSTFIEDYERVGLSSLCSVSPSAKDHSPHVNHLVIGLFYMAALWNDPEAHALLSYRYEHGIGGISKDIETALQYSILPVRKSHEAFFAKGGQPVIEADRIHENTIADIAKGQQGNDDELIQYQMLRAKEGDVPAMLAMGDLYYYGARGLPRDQVQALQYFSEAAALGDPSGMCGAANMYLKGEGTSMNATKAIELYEIATHNGSIRAYNGLGYLYYYGTEQVAKNTTLALQYFLMAAQYETDGDALFNTAYCYEYGIGTEKSLEKAIHYYQIAAKKVGYFGAVYRLGELTLEGIGLPRSNEQALMYFNAVKSISPWMGWLRRGFDLFLSSHSPSSSRAQYWDYISGSLSLSSSSSSSQQSWQHHHLHAMKSLWCYLYAGELGFEVAQSNAAYILRSVLLPTITGSPSSSSVDNVMTTALQDDSSAPSIVLYESLRKDILQRMIKREYLLSGYVHQQFDSYFHLGNCYWFTTTTTQNNNNNNNNHCGIKKQHPAAAMYYYQLASHGGKDTLAAAYLGIIHHFQLLDDATTPPAAGGGTADHERRALRYYDQALQTKSLESNNLYYMVKALQWSLHNRNKSYAILAPLFSLVENLIRNMWK